MRKRRVVVLGGAGDMGAEAVRDLVKFSDFDTIVIADKNLSGAKKLSESLGDPRVSAQKLMERLMPTCLLKSLSVET